MAWLNRILKEIFGTPKDVKGQKERDRYSPGKMEDYFPESMEQPAKMFRKSFGNHYDDNDE